MFSFIKKRLYAEKINGRKYFPGGLLPHKEDPRDFQFGFLHGLFGGYEPKEKVKEIKTISVKDQAPFNTCSWNAYTVQRELDEGVELSVKSIVCYGKQQNYISQDGFATLRDNQKSGIDFGVAEERLLPDVKNGWNDYSNSKQLSDQIKENAATHKSKSYFLVRTKDEWLKALDDNHIIHTGADWYSGYNISGGLTAPWILPWGKGAKIGGHAFVCVGYDIPRGLLKFQNSYGKDWGENGCFYVRMSDWFSSGWVGYVSIDLDQDQLAQFVTQYNGKQVKGEKSPAIYLIQNGEKRAFPDPLTFYAFGGRFGDNKTWVSVSQTLLDKIPETGALSIMESPFWPVLKDNWQTIQWLHAPDSYAKIDALMKSL